MGGWTGRKSDLGRVWVAGLAGRDGHVGARAMRMGQITGARNRAPARFFFVKNNIFHIDARSFWHLPVRQRPYCAECTRSHPNSEVKQRKARIVLGWGTAWEVLRVPLAFIFPQKNTTKTPPQEIMKKQNWRIWLKTMQKNALADFPDNTISRATWSRETGETS